MTDPTKLSLPQIYAEAEAIMIDAEQLFGHLSARQLNWKPSAEQWSVAQCLDHLLVSNGAYFPQLDQIISGQKRATLWERMPGLPRFFGPVIINAVTPEAKRKIKARKNFQPAASQVDAQIVPRLVAQQRDLLARMRATEKFDPARIIITSPIASVVVYSLLDAYRIIVAHERRHFAQAQRVMETSGFPV
jgi:hypothetical protein